MIKLFYFKQFRNFDSIPTTTIQPTTEGNSHTLNWFSHKIYVPPKKALLFLDLLS